MLRNLHPGVVAYGMYKFLVYSNVEEFDPNVVAGLFTYENDEREIQHRVFEVGRS